MRVRGRGSDGTARARSARRPGARGWSRHSSTRLQADGWDGRGRGLVLDLRRASARSTCLATTKRPGSFLSSEVQVGRPDSQATLVGVDRKARLAPEIARERGWTCRERRRGSWSSATRSTSRRRVEALGRRIDRPSRSAGATSGWCGSRRLDADSIARASTIGAARVGARRSGRVRLDARRPVPGRRLARPGRCRCVRVPIRPSADRSAHECRRPYALTVTTSVGSRRAIDARARMGQPDEDLIERLTVGRASRVAGGPRTCPWSTWA